MATCTCYQVAGKTVLQKHNYLVSHQCGFNGINKPFVVPVLTNFIPTKNRDKDNPYFIEVNSTPGLMGIEAVLSKAAAKPLGKELKKQNKSITTEILKLFMNRDNWR